MFKKLFQQTKVIHHANRHRAGAVDYPVALQQHFNLQATATALREISSWHGYQPTPLTQLRSLAADFGLAEIYYKDESTRFGLGSFKALGGAYAVLFLLQQKIREHTGELVTANEIETGKYKSIVDDITVVTATDGNHGRSVAWGAGRFGCACRIYIHAGVSQRRADAMQQLGAEVVRIAGNYDESVRRAAQDARDHGWYVVSDTSYPGYTELPATVMAGYSVMMEEIAAALPSPSSPSSPSPSPFTHIFVQGGVGGLAASVAAWSWETFGARRPRFVVVEPQLADCLLQSAVNNRATEVNITRETMMAGLSCGEVSELAWQVLATAADDFLAIDDELVAPVMAALARAEVEAGESAVAGLAGCLAACADARLKAALKLDARSRVLVLGTEGATDREIYDAIIKQQNN